MNGRNDFVRQAPKAKEAEPRIQPYTNSFHCGLAALTDNASAKEVVSFKRLTPKCGAGSRRGPPPLSARGVIVFSTIGGYLLVVGRYQTSPRHLNVELYIFGSGTSGTFFEAALLFGQTIGDSFLFNSRVARKFSETGRRVLRDYATRSKRCGFHRDEQC